MPSNQTMCLDKAVKRDGKTVQCLRLKGHTGNHRSASGQEWTPWVSAKQCKAEFVARDKSIVYCTAHEGHEGSHEGMGGQVQWTEARSRTDAEYDALAKLHQNALVHARSLAEALRSAVRAEREIAQHREGLLTTQDKIESWFLDSDGSA